MNAELLNRRDPERPAEKTRKEENGPARGHQSPVNAPLSTHQRKRSGSKGGNPPAGPSTLRQNQARQDTLVPRAQLRKASARHSHHLWGRPVRVRACQFHARHLAQTGTVRQQWSFSIWWPKSERKIKQHRLGEHVGVRGYMETELLQLDP